MPILRIWVNVQTIAENQVKYILETSLWNLCKYVMPILRIWVNVQTIAENRVKYILETSLSVIIRNFPVLSNNQPYNN